MALLARTIGPAEFSIFAASYGIAIIIQTVTDFGLTAHIIRSRAVEPKGRQAGSALHLVARINVAVCILGLTAAGTAAFFNSALVPLIPLAVWVAADKHVEAWLGIPLADGAVWQNASSLIFRRSIALFFLLFGIALGRSELYLYCLGLAVGSIVAAISVQIVNTRKVAVGQAFSLKRTLAESYPFYSNSVATQMRNLDTFLVALVLSPVASGLYGAASRLTSPLRIVPTSFANILMPAAARQAGGTSGKLTRPVIMLIAFTSVMYAAIAIVMPYAVPLLLGVEYEHAIPVIQIVCAGLVFAAIASQLNSLLQGWGHLIAVSRISWSTTVFCLLAIVGLGPMLGVNGCGIALALSYVLQVALQAVYMVRHRRRLSNA
ncbi:lipopolysaccharide biosynthesis protein [Rhodococcus fascians]|nr:lipopolysaccharide biosynthesis protein [Rhodococcus fascians]